MGTPVGTKISRRHLVGGLGAVAALSATHQARAIAPQVPVIIGKDGWLFSIWDNFGKIDPASLKEVAQTIGAVVSMLRKVNIQTGICLLPSKSRIYADYMPAGQKLIPSVERLYGQSLKTITATGAITFDLASFLMACRKAAPQTELYFKADTHWLPIAAGSAAAEMARYIKSQANLPPSTQPGMTLSEPVLGKLSFHDLGNLLPLAMQSSYPWERYLKVAPGAQGPESLLDVDTADITVVGNSFMQPEFGYAATLSSELNRPVGLAWRVHQFSPYWNLLDYVKSASFRQNRPKMIVWALHELDMNIKVKNADVWGDTAMAPADFLSQLQPLLG